MTIVLQIFFDCMSRGAMLQFHQSQAARQLCAVAISVLRSFRCFRISEPTAPNPEPYNIRLTMHPCLGIYVKPDRLDSYNPLSLPGTPSPTHRIRDFGFGPRICHRKIWVLGPTPSSLQGQGIYHMGVSENSGYLILGSL